MTDIRLESRVINTFTAEQATNEQACVQFHDLTETEEF